MAKSKASMMRRIRQQQAAVTIPPVKNKRRRAACKKTLAKFCKTYFPATFYMPMEEMHGEIMADMERLILHGGRLALAAPRKSGKTMICLVAILWALLYGHRRSVIYACESVELAKDRVEILKAWLARNDRLHDDFWSGIIRRQ